ncbi:MAG: DGQHR domain-containing protein [Chloroflexota bacterium]|nr:DGQHR domain-containing protein [Chloroflexota bacterium]
MVTIRSSSRQYLELDAQRYQQGGRTAYSLVMGLGTLDSNVPPFVNTERIDNANRRFLPKHSKNIADYIYAQADWVLGAILLGIDPADIDFVPYEDEAGQSSSTLGQIRIPLDGGTSSIKILDGQHRRMGIRTVREQLRHDIQQAEDQSSKNGNDRSVKQLKAKSARLDKMAIPVMIYEEPNTRNLRRMFSDLAQTKNIDAATKTRFDDRDPFNRAAVELVELGRSVLLGGRVEMERTTPSLRSNNLLAINQLARCLKVLCFGYGGRASRLRILEAEHNYHDLIDLGVSWADEFLPSARHEYEILLDIELEEDYIAENRSMHLAYSASVLQLLAGCYHQWDELGREFDELTGWLRNQDFERDSEDSMFRTTGMLTATNPSLITRRQSIQATIDYVIVQARLANS